MGPSLKNEFPSSEALGALNRVGSNDGMVVFGPSITENMACQNKEKKCSSKVLHSMKDN